MIVGQPKSVEELGPLAQSEIDEMIQGATEALANGVPMEVPAAMPLLLLCRMAATFKLQRELLTLIANLPKGITFDEQLARTEAVRQIEEKAAALLQVTKPIPVASRVLSLK